MSEQVLAEYILFKTDARGPDLETVAAKVRSSPEVELRHQGGSALLVAGASGAVKSFAAQLPGWHSELNGKVRAVS